MTIFEPTVTLRLARHDLVRVDPASWAAMLDGRPDLKDESLSSVPAALRAGTEELLADWAICSRPLIARRSACDDSTGLVPLGLPLPPAQGKQRIAVRLPATAIREVAPPPRLADLMSSAPNAWHAALDQLLRLDAGVRAYGSLAWQHLTGLAYLSDTSDLDLLWRHTDTASSEALLAGIAAIELQAPMRIDGELVAENGTAVHWRELLTGAAEVLAKRLDGVALLPRRAFLSARSEM